MAVKYLPPLLMGAITLEVTFLLVVLAGVSGQNDGLGRNAWTCAFDRGMDLSASSEESSSSEEADFYQPCACFHIADEDTVLSWVKLDCSRRGYTEFSIGASLPYSVKYLNVSNNRISFLRKGVFESSSQLEELVFQNNNLIKIEDGALDELVKLQILDLRNNYLMNLQENAFENLGALRILDLSWNKLEFLPSGIFRNVTNLDTLSLSGNIKIATYIHETPEALKGAFKQGLRVLKLNAINMNDIPENFFNEASGLKELDISDNHFVKLPHLWIGGLQVLNISRTNITKLETGSFLSLPNLRVLRLDHLHNLEQVQEGAFIALQHLQVLTLERCYNLTQFNGLSFGGPSSPKPSLHVLNLKHGGLETLSKTLKPIFLTIKKIHLEGNPWNCDCRLKWLKELNFSKEMNDNLLCYSPLHLYNETISSIDSSQFTCMTKEGKILYGLVVSMAVIITVVALVATLAYCDILRRRRATQMTGSRVHYDPLMIQLNPQQSEYYWDDPGGDSSISFIRGNRML